MLLTRLKELREQRSLSLRELADKSKVPYPTISLLENGKREPQGRTTRKLAAALDVEVTDLYSQEPVVLEQKHTPAISVPEVNDNKTIIGVKPARPTKVKTKPSGNFWLMDEDGREWGPYSQEEATERQVKLGKTKIYEGSTRFEVWDKHRAFLIRVARGHDAW